MVNVATILGKIGASLLAALLTEKVIVKLTIVLLEKLVKSTENKLDDDLLEIVKEALEKPNAK